MTRRASRSPSGREITPRRLEGHARDWVVIENGTDIGEETAYSPDYVAPTAR